MTRAVSSYCFPLTCRTRFDGCHLSSNLSQAVLKIGRQKGLEGVRRSKGWYKGKGSEVFGFTHVDDNLVRRIVKNIVHEYRASCDGEFQGTFPPSARGAGNRTDVAAERVIEYFWIFSPFVLPSLDVIFPYFPYEYIDLVFFCPILPFHRYLLNKTTDAVSFFFRFRSLLWNRPTPDRRRSDRFKKTNHWQVADERNVIVVLPLPPANSSR